MNDWSKWNVTMRKFCRSRDVCFDDGTKLAWDLAILKATGEHAEESSVKRESGNLNIILVEKFHLSAQKYWCNRHGNNPLFPWTVWTLILVLVIGLNRWHNYMLEDLIHIRQHLSSNDVDLLALVVVWHWVVVDGDVHALARTCPALLDLLHECRILLVNDEADVFDTLLDKHVHLLSWVDSMADGCLDHVDFALSKSQLQEVVYAELCILLEVKIGRLGDVVEEE